MRDNRLVSLVLVSLLAGGCATDSPIGPDAAALPAASVVATPYDVYRAVLAHTASLSGQSLVVLDETRTAFFCVPSVGGQVGEEWRGAVDNFTSENATSRPLAAGDYLGSRDAVISPQQYRDIFASPNLGSGWRTFYDTYPGAPLVTVSAAGFDADRRRAVVQVGKQCGSLCGEWPNYYLEQIGTQWTVTPLRTCWAVS